MPVRAIKELPDSQWHVPACAIKELLDLYAGQGDLSRLRLVNLRHKDRNRDTSNLTDCNWHVPVRAIKELADSQWHVPARVPSKS